MSEQEHPHGPPPNGERPPGPPPDGKYPPGPPPDGHPPGPPPDGSKLPSKFQTRPLKQIEKQQIFQFLFQVQVDLTSLIHVQTRDHHLLQLSNACKHLKRQ